MKKNLSLSLMFILTLAISKPQNAQAEIPVKARAFLTIAGYGAAGGALLGAASMAFGTSSRAVAQGASLGLYAGILFGTYVLVSHHQKRYGTYEDSSSPYQESTDIYGDEYQDGEGGSEEGGSSGKFFARFESIQERFGNKKRGSSLPPLKINLFEYSF